MALVLNSVVRARGIIRTTVLLPWAIPTVVAALVWRFIFESPSGLATSLAADVGISAPTWFASARAAWLPLILADVWKMTPFVAILLLAGLQNIDPMLYEAADVDGAGPWRRFTDITLPLLRPAITVAFLFRSLDALRVFDLVYVMTGGGPGSATEPIALFTFTALLQNLRFGFASAISVHHVSRGVRVRDGRHPLSRRRRISRAAHMRSRAASIFTAVFLLALLLPVYWAVISSFTPENRLFAAPSLIPRNLVLQHYRALFATRDFWTPIRNSLVVAALTTLMSVALGSMCAYALARLRFRGKVPLLALVLAVSMFPQISIVGPLYLLLRELRLLNSYPGLVLPYLSFAMPLTIWMLVGFFRQLPADLEEAALMDGAGRIRTLWTIVLPLSWPGLVTSGILTFLYCWNEFLFALSFTLGPERYTVPVAIALFRGQYQVPWGEVLAAAVVATIPVAAIVLVAQRGIVAGLTAGAVKG